MKHFKTISEFHEFRQLPKPEHPLISVVTLDPERILDVNDESNLMFGFYFIAIKRMSDAKIKYGQQAYDFDEGIMSFMGPNQVFNVSASEGKLKQSGWILLIHPDFLWNTSLAKNIKQYDFFEYSVNEALLLSEKEEAIINNIVQNIQQEYHSNIDKFSKQIIISQIESLLNYSERFYNRQFITREKSHHQILDRLEKTLAAYFKNDTLLKKGLPTVHYISETLNISQSYLRTLLKTLTGQNVQQYIHNKLVEIAKEKLSTTDLSVSEIAYELGFEHPQSFSNFFKKMSHISPLEFRQSFN